MAVDPLAVAVATLAIGGLYALLAGVRSFVRRTEALEERLAPEYAGDVAGAPRAARPDRVGALARLLAPVARAAMPLSRHEVERLRTRLQQAGSRSEHAVTFHVTTKLLLAVLVLAAFLLVSSRRAQPLGPAFLAPALVFALGYYFPDLVLAARVRSRQTAIDRGLPDALDLLVTCVEAGLGLDAALQRVAEELRLAWPLLGDELRLTFLEIKAGMPRIEAFRRLAARTGVSDLKSLAATLAQTEIFGTSVALALRVQAEGLRVRRIQRAEERAAYAAVKMSLPLVLCILPSLLIVLAGPAWMKVYQVLLPALTRGGR